VQIFDRAKGKAMNEQVVDTRGMACPKPLILTKKLLNSLDIGQKGVVVFDNLISFENVQRFLRDQQVAYSIKEEGQTRQIIFVKGEQAEHLAQEDIGMEYGSCEPETLFRSKSVSSRGDSLVICFKSNLMGQGADDLGGILIQAFINTLRDADRLPTAMLFYNSGVKLVHKDSAVIGALQELAGKGVKIMVCGTCTNYYQISGEIGVGIISNMYEIIGQLHSASSVIYP
jgi:selenium metabolism protein YedF